ncbi:uncharacterized protein LOC108678154 [Hyalella azteca]|uniref:Uncharacterized protein LOC108678154 n=1 Tax=Hyalella azteca TaxID=294128 RepID=A0A8B7P846_HYAAZ|nr:uncharacterized protein LOC108678154 [Hyalella azteca]
MSSSHVLHAALLVISVAYVAAGPKALGFECKEEGRFPNPSDCTSFFTCVKDNDGDYVSFEGSCRGYAFDAGRQVCVSTETVPDCSPRKSRHISSNPQYAELCTNDSFICVDCKTVINCVNGTAFEDSTCTSGFTCQTPASFEGQATCYTTQTQDNECQCEEDNHFETDPYNPNGFYFCPSNGSDPMVYHCPDEMMFDETLIDCTNPEGIPACTKSGVFSNPSNCSQYYMCIRTSSGWAQKIFDCEDDLMFNDNTKNCSDPCSWPTTTFDCTEEGRFADPSSCENFYLCIADPEEEGDFIQTLKRCPLNYIWDPNASNSSGHCASPTNPKTTKCTPVVESTCEIPITCGNGTSRSAPSPSRRSAFRGQMLSFVSGADPIQNVIDIMNDVSSKL